MKHVAIIDEAGIYRGRQEIEDEALTADHIEVDDALEAGKYRWNGSTFVALATESRTASAHAVPLDAAFYALVEQLDAAGVEVGPVASQWARNFERSVDAMKAASAKGAA